MGVIIIASAIICITFRLIGLVIGMQYNKYLECITGMHITIVISYFFNWEDKIP